MSSRYLLLGTGAGAGEFTPADVPETLLWFDSNMTAPDMTLNVDKVINLGDETLTQVTQGSDPKRLVRVTAGDGKLELTSDGVDDDMDTVSNLVLNPCTFRIFSAFRSVGTPVVYRIVSGSDEIKLAINAAGDIEVERGGVRSVYADTGSRPWGDGTYHRLEHVFDGTNAGHTLDVDEVAHSFDTNPQTGNPGTASFTAAMTICSQPDFFFMSGAWRFLAVCAPEPSAADASKIRAYMISEFF